MLANILDNLLFNAIMFSKPETEIRVSVNITEDGKTEIRVSDNGIGIATENQELIFERFFKVDSFTPGCGLGLYICKAFVEQMGGQISLESKLGEGSTFKILFGQ